MPVKPPLASVPKVKGASTKPTPKRIAGSPLTTGHVEDFALAELKRLTRKAGKLSRPEEDQNTIQKPSTAPASAPNLRPRTQTETVGPGDHEVRPKQKSNDETIKRALYHPTEKYTS